MRPALFLDRDGILNEEVHYLYKKEDVRWVAGIHDLIRNARALGYAIIIVTNQAGIGRGLYTEADFHALMDWMLAELTDLDAPFDAVYFSPYHPVSGIGEYKRESDCRKPGPGMLLRAAGEHDLDLARSIMVGDRCSDIAAAASAGVPTRFLLRGTEPAPCPGNPMHKSINSLEEVLPSLIQVTEK